MTCKIIMIGVSLFWVVGGINGRRMSWTCFAQSFLYQKNLIGNHINAISFKPAYSHLSNSYTPLCVCGLDDVNL